MSIINPGKGMNPLHLKVSALAFCFLILTGNLFSQTPPAYPDLIRRLTDMEALSLYPSEGERQTLWTGDDSGIGYITFADDRKNSGAGKGSCRMEGDRYVLTEVYGPGIITSIWAALPGEGRISFFLDGSDIPVIEASLYELYSDLRRDYPHLVYRAGRSLNLFIPIPFRESCKIVADKDMGEFVHFGIRRFPEGTSLPAFSTGLMQKAYSSLKEADNFLGLNQDFHSFPAKKATIDTIELTIHPGEISTLFHAAGKGAITSLRIFPDEGRLVPSCNLGPEGEIRWSRQMKREIPSDDSDIFRELMLSAYWDGERDPSVYCPLGDFFGTAPGWNTYRSLPAGMTENMLYSNWFMPYGNEALITLRNDGAKTRSLKVLVTTTPLNGPSDRYARFHAVWNREAKVTGSVWTVVKAKGAGRLCGLMMDIYNPAGKWWGDCKYDIVADNDESNSISGYGLDALFGTWGNSYFSAAYHAHTLTDRSMVQRDHESLNRWFIADNVPFSASLDIRLEKLFPATDSVSYRTVAYYYLFKEGENSIVEFPPGERIDADTSSKMGVTDNMEGEDMTVSTCTGGYLTPVYVEGLHTGGWSGLRGKSHLWWDKIAAGDTLVLKMPVLKDGEYKIRIQFIKGQEFGTFRFYLDNKLISDSINLSYKELAPTTMYDFGLHVLREGDHSIMFIARSPDTSSPARSQFGLDYLQLEPWKESGQPQTKTEHVAAGEFVNIYNQSNINDHCFIKEPNGLWHFYGIGGTRGFSHAKSESLKDSEWKVAPYPFPVEWDPWKEMHLWAPHIVMNDGIYYMFYCAGGKTGYNYRMHLATSTDLITWTRHPENPLFVDGFDARDPMVLRLDDQWIMYYCANTDPKGGNHVVAYRLSKDLVHWGKRHIAFTDPRIHKAGGPTESPFVVRRGDTYYLFIGPREGYVGTDVFESRSPFQWYLEDKVGHIDSHAAEVVRDENGKWFVSTAGVGEGGIYLAPLYWNDNLDEEDSSIVIP